MKYVISHINFDVESADGFISGLASVAKDALDLSSSDVFLLAVCYEATRAKGGGGGKSKSKNKGDSDSTLQKAKRSTVKALSSHQSADSTNGKQNMMSQMINSESWKGGEAAFQRQRLASDFAIHDVDGSGFLDKKEIEQALQESGYLISSVSNAVMCVRSSYLFDNANPSLAFYRTTWMQ